MSNEETKEQEGAAVEETPTTAIETAADAAVETVVNYFAPEEEAEDTGRNERKSRIGLVASNKMDKTITVSIERKMKHPKYKKFVKSTAKFKAHDEKNECNENDIVRIMETRPLSKDKRWRLVEIIERAK